MKENQGSVNNEFNRVLKQIVIEVLVDVQQHIHVNVLQISLSGDFNLNKIQKLSYLFFLPKVGIHTYFGVVFDGTTIQLFYNSG